ncbi:TIGR02450 family Trp-rich protein [Pseudomonas sp. MWU13-2100]|uniref:TIGR02450 family Trp-rich protein n=1 Tax=Pseudomonas sp. MWU13-2100 TaxID=2935075 RepID=UPI0020100BB6|nr:TIGR02450 family Trp-rich protein [Pseudomonas sp. MWU13-2100]
MNRINPNKLLLSKWTAARPLNREKHFLVTELFRDEQDRVFEVELQAVMSQRNQRISWAHLKDTDTWRMGWQ